MKYFMVTVMNMTKKRSLIAFGSAILLAVTAVQANDDVLDKASELIAKKAPADAYNLLLPLMDERAGSPNYDFLLGMSAYDSGLYTQASFAFERCLATDPKNGPCRIQMARTLIAMGENDAAKAEIEVIKQNNPPVVVGALVNQYLGAIRQREIEAKRDWSAYGQFGTGYDSNANVATNATQFNLVTSNGIILPLVLGDSSRATSDTYLQAELGANGQYALSPEYIALADVSIQGRRYDVLSDFNSIATGVGVGLARVVGHQSVMVKLQGQQYQLDGDAYRDSFGLLGQYQYAVDENAAYSAFAQVTKFDYRQTESDALRYTVGAGYSKTLQAVRWTPTWFVGVSLGEESKQTTYLMDKYLGHDFKALRAGVSAVIHPKVNVSAGASYEQRGYNDISPIRADAVRDDKQLDMSLALSYLHSRSLRLTLSYVHSNTDSNIVLNQYKRDVLGLDARYVFF
jgi:hypothetical protein